MLGRLAWLLIAVTASSAPVSAQRTIRVPLDYATIPAAMAAAVDNDTILVDPGVYPGTVDFGGKTVVLKAVQGAAMTTIRGSYQLPTIRISGGTGTVDGFTITGGQASGVHITDASPTIQDCVIEGNSGYTYDGGFFSVRVYSVGGGVRCISSGAKFLRCKIVRNRCSARWQSSHAAYAFGGGIYAVGCTLLIDGCFIESNEVSASADLSSTAETTGGGLYLTGTNVVVNSVIAWNDSSAHNGRTSGGGAYGGRFVNCNIRGNRMVAGQLGSATYAGVRGSGANCIIRSNWPIADQATGSFTYCNVEGGVPGAGNFDVDPGFVPGSQQLRWDSLCRNRGTVAPELTATDYEGDPRIADGAPDVGADEFFTRLTVTGQPTPGGRIDVVILGDPGARTYWALADRTLPAPLAVPGLQGHLVVNLVGAAVFDLGVMRRDGRIAFSVGIPSPFPVTTFTMQALMGTQFSRPKTVVVR